MYKDKTPLLLFPICILQQWFVNLPSEMQKKIKISSTDQFLCHMQDLEQFCADLVPSDCPVHWVNVLKVLGPLHTVDMVSHSKLLTAESLVRNDRLQVPHQVKGRTWVQAFIVKPENQRQLQTHRFKTGICIFRKQNKKNLSNGDQTVLKFSLSFNS